MAGKDISEWDSLVFLSNGKNCGQLLWIITRCFNGTKTAAASQAGIA
jgi:hypothetical protein